MNIYDIPDINILKDLSKGRPILDDIVRELKLTVVSQTGYQFEPMGYTYAYVLSESHFTIHTYPEYRSCYIDIFVAIQNLIVYMQIIILKICLILQMDHIKLFIVNYMDINNMDINNIHKN